MQLPLQQQGDAGAVEGYFLMGYLGSAVAKSRENAGLSRRQLSAEAGLSPSYVARLERGEVEPSVSVFASLTRVLGWSANDIDVTMRLHWSEIHNTKGS